MNNFFGISDLYMTSLEEGRRIQSRMVDNYLRLIDTEVVRLVEETVLKTAGGKTFAGSIPVASA